MRVTRQADLPPFARTAVRYRPIALLAAAVSAAAAAQQSPEPQTSVPYGPKAQNVPDGVVVVTEAYNTIVTQGGPTEPNPGGPAAPGNPGQPALPRQLRRGLRGRGVARHPHADR